jgi:adenosylhomocysteinase
MRAAGLGASVIVTEIDPIRALKARKDGYNVIKIVEAAKLGDIFVTTTGNRDILTTEHFQVMKDGAILANSGHFNVEIDVEVLSSLAKSVRTVRQNNREYNFNNRRINVIAEGRLVNLAAGDGHPAEVMDMSFTNQALCVRYIAENKLFNGVHKVPHVIDMYLAKMKLESMAINIDEITSVHECHMSSWDCGT